jgi:hypothetical protein
MDDALFEVIPVIAGAGASATDTLFAAIVCEVPFLTKIGCAVLEFTDCAFFAGAVGASEDESITGEVFAA